MTIALWIAVGVLVLANLAVGLMKLVRTKPQLAAMGEPFAWVNDFSQGQIRLIAVAELLGAAGVLLPRLTGVFEWVGGAAAVGLALVQVGAIATHVRRGERAIVPNVVILLLAVFVAVGVFGGF
jgi:hypothetical protein